MTEAILLTPWTDAHDAQTVAWLNDPYIRATFGITSEPTLEGHRQWKAMQSCLSAFAIITAGQHIGNALLARDDRHRSAYLQIYLGSADHRGRGIGRASLGQLLEIAFVQLGLHRVWLHTLPGNAAAERLYRSAGFTLEGTEREAIRTGDSFTSQNRWSLLAREFGASKDNAS
jgi:RimJ/RimL family protein N-acetyltransferase